MQQRSSPIERILAREVLDSRGDPTIEVDVYSALGWGRAMVPACANPGSYEAKDLRDGDPTRYGGRGVSRAIQNIHEILTPHLLGEDVTKQAKMDRLMCELDGTINKSRLGSNAILGISMAVARAAADVYKVPLWKYLDRHGRAKMPMPMINMISGGMHLIGNLDFQDFMLIPIGAKTYTEAMQIAARVYRMLGELLRANRFESVLVGDEGGFAPRMEYDWQAIQYLTNAISEVELRPGIDAAIALDVASTHFYDRQRKVYHLHHYRYGEGGHLHSLAMTKHLAALAEMYPLVSIEDGMAEDDWNGWRMLTERLGGWVQLVGDDIFATNPIRLQQGIHQNVANSVIIKLNQIGTLTETLDTIDLALSAGYRPIVSGRSGETEDAFIADLAVGTGVSQIKIGSLARSERLAKYNQLFRIEEQLPGPDHFSPWQPLVGQPRVSHQ